MKDAAAPSAGQPRLMRTLVAVAAMIGAAALRLYLLGGRSLWIDEGSSFAIARSTWPKLVKLLWLGEANMALYYALLHMWLGLGSSEFALRTLSVVFGVATIPALYLLGKQMFGPSVGLAAALLLAVNAGHIEYSQDARGYTLVMFLVVLSMLGLLRGVKDSRPRNWTAYAAVTALAGYAHLFAMLTVPAYAIGFAFFKPRRRAWKAFAIATGAILALWAPLFAFMACRNIGQLAWVPPTSFISVESLFYLLAGDLYWRQPLAIAYGAGFGLALAGSIVALRAGSKKAAYYGFAWATVFVPFAATIAISHFQPAMVDRYLLICMPSFVLLAAAGLCEIPAKWAARAAVLGLALLALTSDGDYYRYFRVEDWRDATNYVLLRAQPGDAVLVYADEARWPFDYYLERSSHAQTRLNIVFPRWDPYYRFADVYAGGCDAIGPSRASLVSLRTRYNRVWLILSHDQIPKLHRPAVSQVIQAYLGHEYSGLSERDFLGVRVLLYGGNAFLKNARNSPALRFPLGARRRRVKERGPSGLLRRPRRA